MILNYVMMVFHYVYDDIICYYQKYYLSLSFSHDGEIKLLGVDITDYHSFETHIHIDEIKHENNV